MLKLYVKAGPRAKIGTYNITLTPVDKDSPREELKFRPEFHFDVIA